MARELLDSIIATESEAAEKRKNALEEAKLIVKRATENGEKLLSDAEAHAYAEAAKIIDEADKKAAEALEKQKKAYSADGENQRASAEANLPKAVKYIIGELAQL